MKPAIRVSNIDFHLLVVSSPLEQKPTCSTHPPTPENGARSPKPRTKNKQGATHITLRRPKDALIACAKYGRDFYQLTAAQVVLALRAYAAQRIQAQWRGCIPRRRFAPKIVALRKLVQRERAIREARRRDAFGGWKAAHRARMELMRGTRRPFRLWRAESERLGRISELFRGTFWPLYVWRRWANYRVSSRDKVCVRALFVCVPVGRSRRHDESVVFKRFFNREQLPATIPTSSAKT